MHFEHGIWGAIALNAAVAGVFAGWTVENIPIESLGIGGWVRSLAFAAVAMLAPVAGSAALAASRSLPAFHRAIGAAAQRTSDPLTLLLGLLLVALTALAIQSALALSFDPRYRDFPFAPMTGALVPFVLIASLTARACAGRPETAGRDGGRRCARAQRGLHRLERDARQLAGAVVCGNARRARLQPPADAGRARLRISTATASDDSATL